MNYEQIFKYYNDPNYLNLKLSDVFYIFRIRCNQFEKYKNSKINILIISDEYQNIHKLKLDLYELEDYISLIVTLKII